MVEKTAGGKGMAHPDTLVTLGTQDTRQINVRKNRGGNQELTIQKHSQHWAHKTQDASRSVFFTFRTVALSL